MPLSNVTLDFIRGSLITVGAYTVQPCSYSTEAAFNEKVTDLTHKRASLNRYHELNNVQLEWYFIGAITLASSTFCLLHNI